MIITKVVNFNTSTVSEKTNPQFHLKNPIARIDAYAVQSFYGINSYTNISLSNNTLKFIETDSQGTTRNITLPSSNYTITSAMSALQTGLNSQGTATYSVSLDTTTNRVSITSTKEFRFIATSNDAYDSFGFEKYNSAFALTQTANNTYDFSGIKVLNVCSYSFGYNNNVVVNKNLNIICSIPITAPYLAPITFNPNPLFINAQIQELQTVEFMLFDEKFRPVIVDKDWSLSIALQI